jgi:hypothetical protein
MEGAMIENNEAIYKATPVQMRRCLELTMALKNAGIEFVPMPVMSTVDRVKLTKILQGRLGRIEKLLSAVEGEA